MHEYEVSYNIPRPVFLKEIMLPLAELLGPNYALVGGRAVNILNSMETRPTRDIDVVTDKVLKQGDKELNEFLTKNKNFKAKYNKNGILIGFEVYGIPGVPNGLVEIDLIGTAGHGKLGGVPIKTIINTAIKINPLKKEVKLAKDNDQNAIKVINPILLIVAKINVNNLREKDGDDIRITLKNYFGKTYDLQDIYEKLGIKGIYPFLNFVIKSVDYLKKYGIINNEDEKETIINWALKLRQNNVISSDEYEVVMKYLNLKYIKDVIRY